MRGDAVFRTSALDGGLGGTFSIVAGANGGNGIQISNRMHNWNSINILHAPLNIDINTNDYTFTVRGRVVNAARDAETRMVLCAPDEPWEWLANSVIIGNDAFTLTGMLGETHSFLGLQQFTSGVRIQTGGENQSDFIIDDIIIKRLDGEAEPEEPRFGFAIFRMLWALTNIN
ncbi:MAG: hypothetical protein LBI27_08010 [Clostridiales bacterium]|jgi:hypothetical protein|nr:hypothetical protein [Clostridiales bacterium]